MKRRIIAGLLLPALMLAGLALTQASPASADDSNGAVKCALGFCYQVQNDQGSRRIFTQINPGNNNNFCVQIFSWNSGTPTALTPRFQLAANVLNPVIVSPWYEGWKDGTINATSCNTGAKIFTFKVASWGFANGFV